MLYLVVVVNIEKNLSSVIYCILLHLETQAMSFQVLVKIWPNEPNEHLTKEADITITTR